MIILTPGVDGLQHAVEHDRVQQREGHPGAARQALETWHTHVQQVGGGYFEDKNESALFNNCVAVSHTNCFMSLLVGVNLTIYIYITKCV